ncbi:MAG: sulfotransferase [Chitinophagales bacterium]|nr:sulfotransferase [Chitinophagales bacterium]
MILTFDNNDYNLPDFFIVGAPKCGTSAVASYLREHPDIFMPYRKELHHFATDLYKSDSRQFDKSFFYSFFEEAKNEQIVGDASVFHLYSKTAAINIKQFNPEAKILMFLRNPTDMLYSYHSQLTYNGDENLPDFEEAIKAEEDRKKGIRIPSDVKFPSMLYYSDVVRFTEQIKRYYDVFPKEQIKIIIFDDFKSNTNSVYAEILRFLNVDNSFNPDFKVINPNKVSRSPILRRIYGKKPAFIEQIGRLVLPSKKLRRKLLQKVKSANTKHVARPKLQADTKAELILKFKPEVQKLEDLIERDLSSWYEIKN